LPIKPNPSQGGGGKRRVFIVKMAELPEDEPSAARPSYFQTGEKEEWRMERHATLEPEIRPIQLLTLLGHGGR